MNFEEHRQLGNYHYNQNIDYFLISKVFSWLFVVSPLPARQPLTIINNYFPTFSVVENGREKLNNLSRITQLASQKAKIEF